MLPTSRTAAPKRFKIGSMSAMALVLVPLLLVPPLALKWSYEKMVRGLEDKAGLAQEALLECQDTLAGVENDLKREKMARALSDGQLAGAKQTAEDKSDEREQLLAALRDMKAKGEAEVGKAMARVVELEGSLERQKQSAAAEIEEQKKQVAKLNQALKAKKDELKAQQGLIVRQKEELEHKAMAINTLANDRQARLNADAAVSKTNLKPAAALPVPVAAVGNSTASRPGPVRLFS